MRPGKQNDLAGERDAELIFQNRVLIFRLVEVSVLYGDVRLLRWDAGVNAVPDVLHPFLCILAPRLLTNQLADREQLLRN